MKIKRGKRTVIIGVLCILLGFVLFFFPPIYAGHIELLEMHLRDANTEITTSGNKIELKDRSLNHENLLFFLKNIESDDSITVTVIEELPYTDFKSEYNEGGLNIILSKDSFLSPTLFNEDVRIVYGVPKTVNLTMSQTGSVYLSVSPHGNILKYVDIKLTHGGETISEYLIKNEKLKLPSHPYNPPRFLHLLNPLSIIVIMIGYFILIKGLYIIGGVYNPVNPGRNRPPEN
jgi:hypothetical protein